MHGIVLGGKSEPQKSHTEIYCIFSGLNKQSSEENWVTLFEDRNLPRKLLFHSVVYIHSAQFILQYIYILYNCVSPKLMFDSHNLKTMYLFVYDGIVSQSKFSPKTTCAALTVFVSVLL